MRISEIVALDPHLSLRICLDFIFKSASTLTRRVKGTLTPVISLTDRVKGRTLSTSLQVGIYSNPQSEGHTHTGSFFHTQSEGEHSPSLSHTYPRSFPQSRGLTHSLQGWIYTHSVTDLPVSHTELRAHPLAIPLSHPVWRAPSRQLHFISYSEKRARSVSLSDIHIK